MALRPISATTIARIAQRSGGNAVDHDRLSHEAPTSLANSRAPPMTIACGGARKQRRHAGDREIPRDAGQSGRGQERCCPGDPGARTHRRGPSRAPWCAQWTWARYRWRLVHWRPPHGLRGARGRWSVSGGDRVVAGRVASVVAMVVGRVVGAVVALGGRLGGRDCGRPSGRCGGRLTGRPAPCLRQVAGCLPCGQPAANLRPIPAPLPRQMGRVGLAGQAAHRIERLLVGEWRPGGTLVGKSLMTAWNERVSHFLLNY